MKNSVTIQDIAGALGMSRNTVSKALNGKPVPAKTKNAVLSAAIEMGYKGFDLLAAKAVPPGPKRFVILSSYLLMNIKYYANVLRGIEQSLEDHSIDLIQFCVTTPESFSAFKRFLSKDHVDGIICIEFFDICYISELVKFEYPVIFLDFPVVSTEVKGSFDIVLPESQDVVMQLCTKIIHEHKARTFGFIGEYLHCRSFYERFCGMREALFLSGLPVDLSYSILNEDSLPYDSTALQTALGRLPALPDCFVAANDTIAIALMDALKNLHIDVPSEVKVIGFDNIVESKRTTPPLSTVNVNKNSLGKIIAALLLDRIARPTQASQIIYIASTAIMRGTT